MKYISVSELAEIWGISERTVRNYCTQGRIQNAFWLAKTVIFLLMPNGRVSCTNVLVRRCLRVFRKRTLYICLVESITRYELTLP